MTWPGVLIALVGLLSVWSCLRGTPDQVAARAVGSVIVVASLVPVMSVAEQSVAISAMVIVIIVCLIARVRTDARFSPADGVGAALVVPLGNTMWGGTFLPAEVAALGILPPAELVLYGDDNAFSAGLREAGVDIRLCLDIEIHDTVDWHRSAEPARRLVRIPRVLQTPTDQLWRVRYQARNAAHLSVLQARGSRLAGARLAVNAVVRLGLLLTAALIARRVGVFRAILGASVDGLRGRLGESYPLPGGNAP